MYIFIFFGGLTMTEYNRVYNFSAGPSMLPLEVLQKAGAEITNYRGSGTGEGKGPAPQS